MDIRPAGPEDAERISEIRRQDGVREGVLALTSERLKETEDFLASLKADDRALAAVENGETVGLAVLIRSTIPRREHSATLAIMVDTARQGMGIGSALMSAILREADEVLKLQRIELLVLTDNKAAMALYRKNGFEVEAVRKHAAVRNGRFVDEFFMGRLRGEASI